MARFLITVWPLAGHVYPEVSVALALQARGHEVAFYTGERMRSALESEGFEVFPFRRVDENLVDELTRAVERRPNGWEPPGRFTAILRRWWVETIPGQVADVQDVLMTWPADVLVTDPTMWGPIVVLWESLGLPVAISAYTMGCLIPGPDAPPWGPGLPPPRSVRTRLQARVVQAATDLLAGGMRRRVNEIRAQHGLPPLNCSVSAFTARLPLYLVQSVPALDYERRDLPPNVHYVGPCVWNKPSNATTPSWLAELPIDLPWVHATEGTLHHQDPFILRAVAQGLAHRPVQVVITTGPQRDPKSLDLGPRAPNVRVEQWVSYSDLLPRCAVMVTTGGAGTIMAGLQVGLPLVIVPTHWDKPDNAQRVVEAGAGLRLSPQRCTPDRLRAAVERVLVEPHFRANAQRIARELATASGPRRSAELLETLVPSASLYADPGLEHTTHTGRLSWRG